MKRTVWAVFFSVMLTAVQPSSAQPQSAAVTAKQQLTQCMNKRMAASKTMSYNEAMRACKESLQPSKDTLASNGPGENGTKSH